MDIVFGLWADGGAWPPHGGARDGALNGSLNGALGAPVVGPAGLTDLLQTIYGLSGPPASQVERTAAWQRALEATDDGRRFFSASLAADPWSTARLLLDWRDQLVDAGWNPAARYASGRLADLAAAEAARTELPRGPADHVSELSAAIGADDAAAHPARLRLIDRRRDLPAALRRLVDALEHAGVAIEQLEPAPAAPEGTSLGRLQRHLLHGGEVDEALRPDGTVVAARGSAAVLAGEIVADRLTA